MRKVPVIFALIVCVAGFIAPAWADEPEQIEEGSLDQLIPGLPAGMWVHNFFSGLSVGTNGVYIKYKGTLLMADRIVSNGTNDTAEADGHVRIEANGTLWVGEHITYNFRTQQMTSEQFRMGHLPVFAEGKGLSGHLAKTNGLFTASEISVTTDDFSDPDMWVSASRLEIVPGRYVKMWNAVVYVRGVPVFYFPYYKRNLGVRANNIDLLPGFRSVYGPYLLTAYRWYLGDYADGKIHLDYRERRGPGVGPDVNLQMGRWGNLGLKYYYTHDDNSNLGTNGLPNFGSMPQNRQRFNLSYQATPTTNLNVKALVNYQSDPLVLHDFFEDDYQDNPQPDTFFEANRYWDNWSLDALATPRVNNFFDQVERLPDVKLTGFRQQIFNTPIYYDSESSLGYYRQYMVNTNGTYPNPDGTYANAGTRADTFHELVLPWTFFNWLNVTPHVGGRATYYSEESVAAGTNDETFREVFNTGVGASFKVSRLWAGATNSLLEIDGLRHVMEPSVNYVYVPRPSTPPNQLPQYDSELPSLLLLPIQFPDYNDIDSIDSENVIRFGVRNTLQTKRDGVIDNLVDWNMLLDWRLRPDAGQNTFNDLYSKFDFKPRRWLTMESQLRYDINDGHLNLAFHQLTFAPGERWSWGLGHWYLRDNFVGGGANYLTSTFFYRLDDNWGARVTHNFDASSGRLQQQYYTLYRDLRSWTAAFTFRVIDNGFGSTDYTVAFALSLKATPQMHVGDDTVNPYQILGE
jgi:LPS-assembly protein